MHGCPAHDVGHDLGRPVALLVPGKLVAGVAEADHQDQQGQAQPPVELAGLAIGPGQEGLDQVEEQAAPSRPTRRSGAVRG